MPEQLAQATPAQALDAPAVAEIGDPNAGQADILVSGDYTIIGIFLIWAGLIAFAWMLGQSSRRVASDE